MSKNLQPKHGATKLLLSILRITCAVILIKAVFIILLFWLISLEMEGSSVKGPAPEGDYNTRRDWGEQNLKAYFASAENWIKRSPKIANDVGTVYGVAPIRGPNKHGASFGESWTTLNLQVIGPRGEGILRVEEYDWGGRSGQADWQEKHWTYHPFPDSKK